jgi:hypothetical protein
LTKEQERLGEAIRDLKIAIEHLEKPDSEFPSSSLAAPTQSKQSEIKADDLRLNRFKGRKLPEVVLELFAYSDETDTLTIDGLIKEIYIARSEKQQKACRATITAVLHKLKTRQEIEQVMPGVYKLADSTQRRLYAL